MSAGARLATFYFAYFAYGGVFLAYFALYLSARGLSAAQIAVVLAMPQVARLFAPALWGWLADRSGWRRAIVIFGSLVHCAGFATLYAVESYAATVAVMFAMSMLAAGALPVVETLTLAALDGRIADYGAVRLWGSVGFVLTVIGVGAWLDHAPPHSVLDWVVLFAALSVFASLMLPRDVRVPARDAAARLGAVLWRPEVLALFAACFCMTVAHGALYAFYTLYLEAEGYSKTLIGALWTLGVLAEIVIFLALPRLQRRYSLRTLLLVSFACAALRFVLIGWGVASLLLLAFAQLLHAATFGIYHASAVAAVHRSFPVALAARGQALYSSLAYGLGGAVGILLAGWTWETLGAAPSFAVSALFGAAGGVLVAWKVRV